MWLERRWGGGETPILKLWTPKNRTVPSLEQEFLSYSSIRCSHKNEFLLQGSQGPGICFVFINLHLSKLCNTSCVVGGGEKKKEKKKSINVSAAWVRHESVNNHLG